MFVLFILKNVFYFLLKKVYILVYIYKK